MHQNNRVRLQAPSNTLGAAIGATQDGGLFSFPVVNDGRESPLRPAPVFPPSDGGAGKHVDASEDQPDVDVGKDGGMAVGGVNDRGSSGGAS